MLQLPCECLPWPYKHALSSLMVRLQAQDTVSSYRTRPRQWQVCRCREASTAGEACKTNIRFAKTVFQSASASHACLRKPQAKLEGVARKLPRDLLKRSPDARHDWGGYLLTHCRREAAALLRDEFQTLSCELGTDSERSCQAVEGRPDG